MGHLNLIIVSTKSAQAHYEWRTGDEILSTITFQVPKGATSGNYSLLVSLFDPNQKKNAVYFSPQKPQEPIVVIKRTMHIDG